jgi:transcriptional regulator GlxA family with amidase domain
VLRNVAVVVLDGFSPFELGAVCEVFGIDRTDDGLPAHDFAVVAGEPGPLHSETGFTLQTGFGLDRLQTADLIAVHRDDPAAMPDRAAHPAGPGTAGAGRRDRGCGGRARRIR